MGAHPGHYGVPILTSEVDLFIGTTEPIGIY